MLHGYMPSIYLRALNAVEHHGSSFQAIMNSINSSSVMDPQRPAAGYSIMFDHELQEHQDLKDHQMNYELGRNVITSNRNRTLVSDSSKNLFPNQSLDSSFISWSERRKKEKLLDSLLHRSAQTAATDGKTLALIGASGNGGDQDVDSSVIYTEGCHSMPPSELVKDAHEAHPWLFQIKNIEIHAEGPYDEKPLSMKDALLLCYDVELGAFEDESSNVRVQNGLRKSKTPPNSPDFVYISDD
ncbi:hypothetical protein ZIOFF_055484 [Zingiber officinale]|uniref:Uncharacterized protein n=1 Tax=Zingiber officinale TaxID=94328 RepID=A0A8J5KKC8_ZINOF|nr:hypothetical protein ZIOFF_055484 [Zingiber officinale]